LNPKQQVEVAMVGLGPIGILIAQKLLGRPDLHVSSAVDIDPAKAGRDLGDLVGVEPNSVIVTPHLERGPVDGLGVCVLCTFSRLDDVVPQIETLAGLGWSIVSTCEELTQPWSRPELASRVDVAARQAGVAVLGAGINPGYLLDTLPLLLTAACVRVDAVRVRRIVDTNERRVPLQLKAGVGLDRSTFLDRVSHRTIGHVGLEQSAQLVAEGLRWHLDGWHESVEPVVAHVDTQTGVGVVRTGQAIGLRQVAAASVLGREVITYELQMFAGASQTDEISIDGDPGIRSSIVGGLNGDVGTAAVVANLIQFLAGARPGLLTMRDAVPFAGLGGLIGSGGGRTQLSPVRA
jgi:4-hydroxy-tetrahydrodipicolinate reductase